MQEHMDMIRMARVEQVTESTSLPRRDHVVIFIAVTLASLLVTAFSIVHSIHRGRLSFLPTYDDVAYMISSLRLLDLLYTDGIWSALVEALRGQHHSGPFSLLGAVGYLIFGPEDFAPYASLSVLLAVTLFLVMRTIRQPTRPASLVFLSLMAGLPLIQMAIAEFRPDLFWGLFVGYGAFKFVFDYLGLADESRIRWPWEAALVFALGAILKPTALIASTLFLIGVVGVPVVLSLARRLLTHAGTSRPCGPRAAAVLGARFLSLSLLFQLPFTFPKIQSIIAYTWDVLVVNRALWGQDLSIAQTMAFYPTLLPILFSYGLVLAALLWAGMFGWSAFQRGIGVWVCLASFGLLAWAYAVPTVPRNKSIFLGAQFYGVLFWSMPFLYQFVQTTAEPIGGRRNHGSAGQWVGPVMLCVAIVCALVMRDFDRSAILNRKVAAFGALDEDRRATLSVLMRLARANASEANLFPLRAPGIALYVNTVGPFDFETLKYQAMKEGIAASMIQANILGEEPSEEIAKAKQADIVLLAREDARGLQKQFTGYRDVPQIEKVISRDPGFIKLLASEWGQPEPLNIYVKRKLVVRATPGQGWQGAEGPYQQLHLPVVRWMIAPSADINMTVPEVGRGGSYVIECQTSSEKSWGVFIDSERVASATTSMNFQPIAIPLERLREGRGAVRIALDEPESRQNGGFALCRAGTN